MKTFQNIADVLDVILGCSLDRLQQAEGHQGVRCAARPQINFERKDTPAFCAAVVGRPATLWQQAGGTGVHQCAGFWWAAVDKDYWPTDKSSLAEIKRLSEKPHGDRRQELVFIGQQLDEPKMRAALDAALLTDREMAAGAAAWSKLPDPFPEWKQLEPVNENAP